MFYPPGVQYKFLGAWISGIDDLYRPFLFSEINGIIVAG
jgi:hypothetical protein